MPGWQDIRYAARSIRKSPGFAAVAVVTLALGIGATTIIFSVVDGILINPFPYKDPDRLTSFFIHDPARPKENGIGFFSMADFIAFRDGNHVFEDVMGNSFVDVLYTANGETQLFTGALVTPNMMEFLGVAPLVGRWMTAADGKPEAPPTVVMSYRIWNERFNRDPTLVGQTLMLNNVARTLTAVMPPRFLPANADMWFPLEATHGDIRLDGAPVFMAPRGRLKPGVTLEAAAADLTPIATRLAQDHPRDFPKQFTVLTRTFADNVVGDFKGMLYALMAGVALVLLIACSNVANLLLARATTREREIAIRASLGAGRARLISQLVIESLLLSLLGCALGCLFALAGLKGVVAMIPPNRISATSVIAFSPMALTFAVAVSLVTTILCGWAPALHAVRGELSSRLAGSGKGTGAGFRHGRLRAGLVVFEVALSILLLVGGVVADAKNQGLQEPPMPEAFVPFNVTGMFNRGVLIRTAVSPASLISSVRREIFAIDSGVALAPPTGALEDSLRQISYSGPAFGLTTFAAFAGVGLVLVIVGVFSVMAYAVSLQTHEIGVRMALGAQRSDILRMVLRNGLTLVAIGSVIGVAASAALARVMASQIWGVSPTDPATLGAVLVIVLVVGLAACLFPARNATRVDPLIALRYD